MDSDSDRDDAGKFEIDAEDIAERNVRKEAEMVSDVKAKYSSVIRELEGQGTFETRISCEVQEKMRKEIEIIKQDFSCKKDVSSLRDLLKKH